MTFILFLEQLFNGIQFGMMLFLMAVGVTLVFGVMDVINLSHGSLYMLGGYFLAASTAWVGNIWGGIAVAVLVIILFSLVLEAIIFRPLYHRGHLDQVLATFGLILLFNESVVMIWGREPLFVSLPEILSGQVEFFPDAPYPAYRIVITAVATVLGIALYLLITKTRVGMLVRAGAEHRVIVEALGVNVARIYSAVFALGGFLAGISGMLMAPLLSVETGSGEPILILTLVVVIIGGVGSVKGALAASLAVGIFDTFGRIILPELLGPGTGNALSSMTVYVLMVVVLAFRPQGIFTTAKR